MAELLDKKPKLKLNINSYIQFAKDEVKKSRPNFSINDYIPTSQNANDLQQPTSEQIQQGFDTSLSVINSTLDANDLVNAIQQDKIQKEQQAKQLSPQLTGTQYNQVNPSTDTNNQTFAPPTNFQQITEDVKNAPIKSIDNGIEIPASVREIKTYNGKNLSEVIDRITTPKDSGTIKDVLNQPNEKYEEAKKNFSDGDYGAGVTNFFNYALRSAFIPISAGNKLLQDIPGIGNTISTLINSPFELSNDAVNVLQMAVDKGIELSTGHKPTKTQFNSAMDEVNKTIANLIVGAKLGGALTPEGLKPYSEYIKDDFANKYMEQNSKYGNQTTQFTDKRPVQGAEFPPIQGAEEPNFIRNAPNEPIETPIIKSNVANEKVTTPSGIEVSKQSVVDHVNSIGDEMKKIESALIKNEVTSNGQTRELLPNEIQELQQSLNERETQKKDWQKVLPDENIEFDNKGNLKLVEPEEIKSKEKTTKNETPASTNTVEDIPVKKEVNKPIVEKPVDEANTVNVNDLQKKKFVTDGNTTGAFNEDINKRRLERGVEKLEEPLRKNNEETWQTAKDKVESGKLDPRKLAQTINKKARPLTDIETTALHQDAIKLHVEKQDLLSQLDEAYKNKTDNITELEGQKIALDELQNLNDKALKRGGTETARSLQIRQLMANDEMDLVKVLRDARIANPEKPLSIKEESFYKNEVEKYRQATDDLNKRLNEQSERISKLESQKSVERIKRQANLEERSTRRKATKENIQSNLDRLKEQLIENSKKRAGKLSANNILDNDIPILTAIAKEYVKSGIVDATELVDKVYNHVKDIYDDISLRDVRDAISGYGRKSIPTKDETVINLRNSKTEMRLISAIEDAQNNIKKGKNAPKEIPENIQKLKSQLNEELKSRGLKEDISDETKIKSYKTRLENNIKDLENKLSTGNFDKSPRKSITEILDKETLQKKAYAERLRDNIKNEIRKREQENRPAWEKSLDFGVKMYRQALLSGVSTIGKLTNYGAIKTIFAQPFEDLIGEGLGKAPGLNKIFEKAPSEGNIGLGKAGQIYAKSFVKWTDEMIHMFDESGRQQLKTGKSSLDYAFNDKQFPPEIAEFFGHLHGVLKEPAKQANFMRSLLRRTEFAIKEGKDITNPEVSMSLSAMAYQDALRSILLNDNKMNTLYRQTLGILDRQGTTGKIAKGIVQTILPIVKVPTNFVFDVMGYLFGGFKAGAIILKRGGGIKNLGSIYKTALEKMSPEDADMVARLIKKNVGLGAVAFVIGALNPDNFGGYYTANEKRDKGDVKAGKMRLFGYDLPNWMTHLPPLEAMQFGASFTRAINSMRKANKSGEKINPATEIADGLLSATTGLIDEIPFFSSLKDEAKPFKNGVTVKSTSEALGEKVSGFIPPDVKRVATGIDTQGDKVQNTLKNYIPTQNAPETIKRKPEGFIQTIESNLPVLRENISSDEDKKLEKMQTERVKNNLPRMTDKQIEIHKEFNLLEKEQSDLLKEVKDGKKSKEEISKRFNEIDKRLTEIKATQSYQSLQNETNTKAKETKNLKTKIKNIK